MEKEDIKAEIGNLRRLLYRYQHLYYVLSRPEVSDAEYDRLMDRLVLLEKTYPEFADPDSPSMKVGSDISQSFPEVEHTIPVLSLDKCTSFAAVKEWIGKTEKNAERPLSFVVEEKIDGASIVLYYEEGRLSRAVTRGNGIRGNDITGNVMTIKAVPLKLPKPVTLAVRGEIFLPVEYFDRINSSMEIPYANPRNLASGTLRRVKSSEVASVPLDIFTYEGFSAAPVSTHIEILENLAELGFRLNGTLGVFSDRTDLEEIRKRHPHWRTGKIDDMESFIASERERRSSLDYEIDGLVIKVNEIPAREALGYTGHHPRWAIAYKFESPEGLTRVKKIDVQVGRTGRITPVARVEPVEISGSVITNVTLHNEEYVHILELGEGDVIVVSKRGDVIPSAESVSEHCAERIWNMPESCPSCGSRLEKKGAHHFCTNEECEAKNRGRLYFFVGKGQMDIDYCGPETIDLLYKNGYVRDIQDIYRFDPDRLLHEPGFGEKKVGLLKKGISESKKKPYRIVLQSLGIPELGPKVAELLIEAGYRSIDSLLEAAGNKDTEPLVAIDGIGEKTALTIIGELSRPEVRKRIDGLKKAGLSFSEPEDRSGPEPEQICRGQTWCVTGSFRRFKPREKAMEEVKRRGGRVTSSISTRTTHLLAGPGAGGKLDKARSLGISVVDEDEFLRMMDLE
ncbi:MAG: NAD-dependent DNA ligase LigA [Spirochaetales bacterium]|nr:NAD-dependent DNA ligase LigA [Spirochaetales bacterium]